MKTNRKIEIGILIAFCLLGIIFLSYIRANLYYSDAEMTELTGNFKTVTTKLENFNRLRVTADIPVIYKSGSPKIELYTDESLLDKFDFEISGSQLTVSNTNEAGRVSNEVQNNSSITIYNDEELSYLKTEKNVYLKFLDTLQSSEMIIECDGNANIQVLLISEFLDIDIDGNSHISIKGKSDKTELSSEGNARFYMEDFPSKALKIRSGGNSGGEAFVTESIDAKTSANSQVTLIGNPSQSNISSRANSHINTKFGN